MGAGPMGHIDAADIESRVSSCMHFFHVIILPIMGAGPIDAKHSRLTRIESLELYALFSYHNFADHERGSHGGHIDAKQGEASRQTLPPADIELRVSMLYTLSSFHNFADDEFGF